MEENKKPIEIAGAELIEIPSPEVMEHAAPVAPAPIPAVEPVIVTPVMAYTASAPIDPKPVPAGPAPKKKLSGVWEFLRFAAMVIIAVLIVRVFIAQPFVVSGTSMVPTFQNSNYLIVDELSYRFESPQRGDVIVFHPPIDPASYYIKRIIGIPGDTITITNSVVTITNTQHPNGEVLSEPYITPDAPDDNFSVTVPAGEYFTMGDNRPASFDSRKWGLLPAKNITGRVLFRLFPFNEISALPGKVTID